MSYENTLSAKEYFVKRIRRVFPGYLMVIIVSSFVLFFVSTKNLENYFSIDWVRYVFANAFTLNFIQYSLPGVFEENFMTAVNGALWTIKVELMFYFMVPVIVYLFAKINKLAIMVMVYVAAVIYSLFMISLGKETGSDLYLVLERQIPGQLAFFISGGFLYYYFDEFKRHSNMILLSVILLFVFSKLTGFYFLYPATLAVLVIYSAMIFRYLGRWGKFGDFSFGIYIWHFPVIQIFLHFKLFDFHPYYALMGLILTVLFIAFLSWHFIEKSIPQSAFPLSGS